MKYLALIYAAVFIFQVLWIPFHFGEPKEDYTPKDWMTQLIILSPLIYLLIWFFFNK